MSDEQPGRPAAILNRGGAADQIIADLKDQILRGELPRGAKLPNERELAERYQVSIPTIRESVRGLAAIKLVEPRHGAGTYVTAAADDMFMAAASALIEIEPVGLLDILEVLEALYARASILACRQMTSEELQGLTTSLAVLEDIKDREAFVVSLKSFLGRLAEASHNTLIITLCRFLVGLLLEVAREQTGQVLSSLAKKAGSLQADRRDLVDALGARDEERARLAAIRYHQHTRNLVGDILKAGQEESRDSMRRAVRRLRGAN
jgi:GntR family transcriptional repressor for pyruvate dehydrogenase complex